MWNKKSQILISHLVLLKRKSPFQALKKSEIDFDMPEANKAQFSKKKSPKSSLHWSMTCLCVYVSESKRVHPHGAIKTLF